jgi:hypothetical protein
LRNDSPVPSFAVLPVLMICCAMWVPEFMIYLP